MVNSTVRVPTPKASRYLQQLCKHWRHNLAVQFDLVDPIAGGIREEQFPGGTDGRAVGVSMALTDELPLLAGNQDLKDVLTGLSLRVGLHRCRPVAP